MPRFILSLMFTLPLACMLTSATAADPVIHSIGALRSRVGIVRDDLAAIRKSGVAAEGRAEIRKAERHLAAAASLMTRAILADGGAWADPFYRAGLELDAACELLDRFYDKSGVAFVTDRNEVRFVRALRELGKIRECMTHVP